MTSLSAILFLTTLLCSPVFSDDYRLPAIYSPSNYDISFSVDENAFTSNSYLYYGTVSITLEVTNATKEIQLHASYEYISIRSIQLNTVAVTNFTVGNVTDIASIYLETELVVGMTYTLFINYVGTLSTEVMNGFFRSSYINSNNERVYALATQFEPVRARKAFPCFDEPGLKATFDLTIRHPETYSAVSNMDPKSTTNENTFTTTVFNTSPKMPTYLLAYVISDLTCNDDLLNDNSLRHSVCSRSSTATSRQWAVEITPSVIDTLNSYTGFNYSQSMTKLNQVAIPGFSGAMENWGVVTYSESALLWDSNESTNSYKQYIATVIAHELGHQWFGNLVTTKWWSTTFLNEGFASFFEYYVPHQILPDYEIAHQFVTKMVQPVLLTDSSITANPLESDASTPTEISGKFDTITYYKGGSVLKMVEHFLTPDIFQVGVQKYLSTHQYGSAVSADLWTALETSANYTLSSLPVDLSTVMENWITKSGYPVINVTLTGSVVTFTQERFLLSRNQSETKWYVPISYTTSDNKDEVENTLPRFWLSPDDESVTINYDTSASSWILVNNKETGFYRVNYDSALWSALSTALRQTNFSNIPDINRAQVADDAFNLARANYLTYSKVFDVIQFLNNDISYHSWYAAIRGFDFLIGRVGLRTTLGTAIGNHFLNLSSTVRSSVPIANLNSSDHVYTLNQNLVHTWACKLGDQSCVASAQQLFEDYKSTSVKPYKDLRSVVYCYALKYSEKIVNDWEFLWNAYLKADVVTEKALLLTSLGCAADESVLNAYLLKAVTDNSGISSQDSSSVFSAVYSNNADVALSFLINNYDAVLKRFKTTASVGSLIKSIVAYFNTDEQLDNLNSFINSSSFDEQLRTAANEAVETVVQNLDWTNQYKSDLLDYYGITETTSTTTTTTTTTRTTQSTSATTEKPGGAAALSSSVVLVIVLVFVLSFLLKY